MGGTKNFQRNTKEVVSQSPVRQNTDLFVPTVDGNFVPAEPIELLRNGNFSKIPWLTGVNAGEGLLNTGSNI